MSVSAASADGRTFMLPDLGEGLTEAEVIRWHVAPGDEVQVDQIVVTVETAKASVDLPCPFAGPILTLHGDAGAVLEVGKPLLTVGRPQKSGSGNVLVGYGTSEARRSGRRRVSREMQPAASGAARTPPPAPTTPAPTPGATPKVISPVVRRLARDNQINLAELTATGPGDVICRADVEAAVPDGEVDRTSPLVNMAHRPAHADKAGDLRIPLRGVRKAIAVKMTTSRREIPEATTWVDVDATALIDAKNQIKAVNAAAGIGVLALFARISVAGLVRFPQLNAWVDVKAQEIVQLRDINLSFAAASPRGLVVPVVHGADQMTTAELAGALRELTDLARDGRLSPAQTSGGTFTLNNYGVFGTDGATPIINYPEAAMLGVGRIIDRPWAHDGQVALRKVAQLGLTFDHRVCDGAAAGGFLRFVADCVERPALLLAEL
jgi:2-oxoisovalerate dehydrogenase E2 component (dihydrolipoyl transacylase)